jgi:hypothetical protein
MVEGLTTALSLQKPLINDLHRQGVLMVITLKMNLVLAVITMVLHEMNVKL